MLRTIFSRRRPLVLVVAAAATLSLALAAGFHARGAYRYLNVFQEVWGLTRANYVDRVDEDALLVGAYRGMLSSLDASSAWLDTDERKLLRQAPGPARAGMQVLLSGGIPVVVRVDPGGPAAGAGLERGDQIWRIDGRPTRQLAWPILDRMLRGEPGRVVELVILDASNYKRSELSLTLAEPRDDGFLIEVQPGTPSIALLRLTDADRVATGVLATALAGLRDTAPGAALLVDLRGQVGLEADMVTSLAPVLLPRGDVLSLADRQGKNERIRVDVGPSPWDGALYVLVDGGTAGAAEALAAVARERGSAVLCGRKTYGLAGVPEVISLTHGGTILLSTREMRTPSGMRWAPDGLEPDKVLAPRPALEDEEDAPRDRLLAAALEWIRSGASLADADRPAA